LNEMTLIKAEAYARSGNTSSALIEVNKIRNASGLSSYTGSEVLREVFKQRFYELFITGNHWEDLRRFKSDNIDLVNFQRSYELAHEWLVYTSDEVDTNPNCPAQPTSINYGF
jgi:hypothetical protein